MSRQPMDSTGKHIAVGDRVQWRGQPYTIKAFGALTGRYGSHVIEFEEPGEAPDEIGIDLLPRKS